MDCRLGTVKTKRLVDDDDIMDAFSLGGSTFGSALREDDTSTIVSDWNDSI